MKHKINHIKLDIMDLLDGLLVRWGLTQEGQGYESIRYDSDTDLFVVEVDGDIHILKGKSVLGVIFQDIETVEVKSYTYHWVEKEE